MVGPAAAGSEGRSSPQIAEKYRGRSFESIEYYTCVDSRTVSILGTYYYYIKNKIGSFGLLLRDSFVDR